MFNEYPYFNITDLNLDYILKAIKNMRNEVTNFVSINAVKYANPIQWNITKQYEKNTIVIDPVTGTAYISVAPVPAGIALTREEFWAVVFDLGSFVTKAAQNFTSRWENETTLTATFSTPEGAWLVWGDVLYKALVNITAGDQYVVDSNIEHFTIEDLYNEYLNAINSILTTVGNLVDLNTDDKTSIVNAINSAIVDYSDKIATLRNSRNEIVINVKDFGAVGDGVHDDTAAINDAIDSLKPNGGTIFFPAGDYAISDTIFIGDGTARTEGGLSSATPSSYSNIKFKGVGCDRTLPDTMISQIRPTTNITAVIMIDGRITNIDLEGLCLYANGLAAFGIYMSAASHCNIKNIYIWNATDTGIKITGGALPTGNYCNFNYFENIIVAMGTNNSHGLELNGVLTRDGVSVSNDVWLNTFINCRFQCAVGVLNTIAGVFMVTDHCTFIRCHFVADDPSGIGVLFSAANSAETNPFPIGLSFIDCSIVNYQMQDIPDDLLYCGKQYFLGAGCYDNEVIPRNEKMYGFDVSGRFFGGFGCAKIYDYDDLVRNISVVPNGYCIQVMLSPTFSQTYFDHSGYFSGHAQRISDNYVQLNVHDNVRSCYVIFDLTTATRIAYGVVGQYKNLSTLAELSALVSNINVGETLDCSLMPAFMTTYFSLNVGVISSGKLILTSATSAELYIDCLDNSYYIDFDPTTNTVIKSGAIIESAPQLNSISELVDFLATLHDKDLRTVTIGNVLTNALTGVTTESQATIFNLGGGASQIEISNNVGLYYVRVLNSDASILQSGYITFTQNP